MNTILAGTYTTPGQSRGVYRLTFDGAHLSAPELVMDMRDPSYLLMDGEDLLAVDENLSGTGMLVRAEKKDGGYARVMSRDTEGIHPCHLAVWDGWTAVANYTSGSVLLLNPGMGKRQLFPGHHGGPNAERQESAHAHFVVFAPPFLFACDLGADQIRRFHLEGEEWKELCPVDLPGGIGPRHMVVRENRIFLITELSRELLVLDRDFRILSRTALAREGTGAALKTDGQRLYLTLRGPDLVKVFSMEDTPSLLASFPAGGEQPRDLLPLPDGILVACQAGSQVVALSHEGRVLDRQPLGHCVCLIREE